MQINGITNVGVAQSVWNAAARTLTADPATTAVAGVNVWATAARSLTVDPATDAGAATFVWTHATRSLVTFGAALVAAVGQNQSLGSGNTVDLRPPSGKIRDISAAVDFDATNATRFVSYDGSNNYPVADPTGAAYYQTAQFVGTTSLVGMRLVNGSASGRNYQFCAKDHVL